MTSDELRKMADSRGWRTIGSVDDALRAAADEIDRLEKRVKELEADANRYRWFSANVVLHTAAVRRILFMIPRTTEQFDAAIDAAIAESAK